MLTAIGSYITSDISALTKLENDLIITLHFSVTKKHEYIAFLNNCTTPLNIKGIQLFVNSRGYDV